MNRVLLMVLALGAMPAAAQTAAELVATTSIQSTLDKSLTVRLPTGASFVRNPAYASKLGPSLLGAESGRFGDYQLFVARGVATGLAPAFVANLKSNFVGSGFLESGARDVKVGADTWNRTDFQSMVGRTMVLFVTRRADGVYFLTATSK